MIEFPVAAFGGIVSFKPIFRNSNSQLAMDGFAQVTDSGAGYWQGTISNLNIRDRRTHLLWRQLQVQIRGCLNPFILRTTEGKRQPRVSAPQIHSRDGVPFLDDTRFSDGAGFREELSFATLAAPLVEGQEVMTLTMAAGVPLEGGQYVSIDHSLFVIGEVDPGGAGAPDTYEATIWPPVGHPADVGAVILTDRPTCLVRLRDDTAMAIDPSGNRFATVDLDVREETRR